MSGKTVLLSENNVPVICSHRILTFLFAIRGIWPALPRHSYDQSSAKSLLKSWQVNANLSQLVWAWNQNPLCSMASQGLCLRQNIAVKACNAPAIPGLMGAGVSNEA